MQFSFSDEDLILFMRLGKEEYRELLLLRYWQKMSCLCHLACPFLSYSFDLAEFSSSYLKVFYMASNNYRLEGTLFETYFVNALRNEIYIFLHKEKVRREVASLRLEDTCSSSTSLTFGDVVASPALGPKEEIIHLDSARILAERSLLLSREEKRLISLRREGKPYEECAKILGLTRKQVRVRMNRIRKCLLIVE